MKEFMDKDFLLETDTAKTLFHNYASKMPVLDYHCHLNPEEIATDKRFKNITEVWLSGDHYKWRLMRGFGVDEKYITGDASDKEKFFAFAQILGKAIGNPVYHWAHLELQRYFGYNGTLNEKTAEEVWNLCNDKLSSPDMSARGLIKKSGVTLICTTDDPIDDLKWHEMIMNDKSFDVIVAPAWRPDRAMSIEKDDFASYIAALSDVSEIRIESFDDLKAALRKRLQYFASKGCTVTDHGMNYAMYVEASDEEVQNIFKKKMAGETLSEEEVLKYQTTFLLFEGEEITKLGWVMQLHFSCKRNNNTTMFKKIGPDTGFDAIAAYHPMTQLADFLDALKQKNALPKTILYSLNPNDLPIINTIAACFNEAPTPAKVQQGSAWWFNDTKLGMEAQLKSMAESGNLSGFVGMLTDSRSFTSYPRHEYFRRILCNFLGNLVENGEFPADMEILGEIVSDISYNNAVRYFEFPLETVNIY